MELWIPVLLFVIGFIALFLELFVPAAGIIGAAGIICMIVATVLAYNSIGKLVGSLFLTGVLVGTPSMIMLGLKVFPRSFIGKRLILHQSMDQEEGFNSAEGEKYKDLLGKEGITVTMLRPSGMVRIDGKKYSVVTSGELIEKEEMVSVIRVEGNRIVVRRKSKRTQI
jgi:membrane-bound serine protease (ClpP class)